jgi:hypothetical protein
MQRRENVIEKTIHQMELQDAKADLKDCKINLSFVHRFIRKHAIAYHPYIEFKETHLFSVNPKMLLFKRITNVI